MNGFACCLYPASRIRANVWRFSKADPSVDLVHFTILRPPENRTQRPSGVVPDSVSDPRTVRGEDNEFNLIIFDRYRRRGVLPGLTLKHRPLCRRRRGGANRSRPCFRDAGEPLPNRSGRYSARRTDRQGERKGIAAQVTQSGNRHPVTADLVGAGDGSRWGRWFRQIEATRSRDHTLMEGIDGKPLLILDRVGEGRVAQLQE